MKNAVERELKALDGGAVDKETLKRYDGYVLITPDKLRGVYRTRLASSSRTGQQLDAVITVEDDGCWYVHFEVCASRVSPFVTKGIQLRTRRAS